jgi:hypothetical protein
VDELAKRLPARPWQRLSAGSGAKGPRWYDWALTEAADQAVTEGGEQNHLLDLLPPVDQSSIPGSTCGWSKGTG